MRSHYDLPDLPTVTQVENGLTENRSCLLIFILILVLFPFTSMMLSSLEREMRRSHRIIDVYR